MSTVKMVHTFGGDYSEFYGAIMDDNGNVYESDEPLDFIASVDLFQDGATIAELNAAAEEEPACGDCCNDCCGECGYNCAKDSKEDEDNENDDDGNFDVRDIYDNSFNVYVPRVLSYAVFCLAAVEALKLVLKRR